MVRLSPSPMGSEKVPTAFSIIWLASSGPSAPAPSSCSSSVESRSISASFSRRCSMGSLWKPDSRDVTVSDMRRLPQGAEGVSLERRQPILQLPGDHPGFAAQLNAASAAGKHQGLLQTGEDDPQRLLGTLQAPRLL